MSLTTNFFKYTATMLVFVASPLAALANDTIAPDAAWTLPSWAANDQRIKGAVEGDAISDSVRIRYQINESDALEIDPANVVRNNSRVEFTLPKMPYDTYGEIRIWAADAKTGDRVTAERAIAIADWREFDISGQTAVELLYPMKSWNMQIRFTPCCLINGGYLRVERVPVNPVGRTDGLPETLASAFLHLEPDDVVVATSGLNADIEIDPGSPYADTPEDITVYGWSKGRWTPVHGAALHVESNSIRFKALEGGFFVLAPKPGAKS